MWHEADENFVRLFWLENTRGHFRGLGVYGRMILNWVLAKWVVTMLTAFI